MAAEGAVVTETVRHLHNPPMRSGSGGNGNETDLHGRLATLEAELKHLATKEDIRRIEALIARREASLQRWLIGVIGGAAVALTLALLRIFID